MRRTEPRISPFLFSLLLHALVSALVITGFAAPSSGGSAAARVFKQPEAVDVRLVDASEANALEPDRPSDLVSEHASRAADRGPRDLPEGAPFNKGESSAPSATPGEGGRDDRPRSAGARPSAPAATSTADRSVPPAESPASARGEERAAQRPAADAGELAAAGSARRDRTAPSPASGAPASTLGDARLAIPRRDLTIPPSAPGPGAAATPGTGRRGLPQVDNRLTRASFQGDFSLSTYAWDYAPYMARLKKQIEDYTWTILPSAFWYGIAAWATQVRFTILPDGRLESIAITGHDGVLELRHVAPDAVTGAANFEPLPPGFPDPKLTIVGNFYFNEFPPSEAAGDGSREGGQGRDRSNSAGGAGPGGARGSAPGGDGAARAGNT